MKFTTLILLLAGGVALANVPPAQAPQPPAEKPQWIIADSKAAIAEARAIMAAFKDGGLTIHLTNPPKTEVVVTPKVVVVTPKPDLPGRPVPQVSRTCADGACQPQLLRPRTWRVWR